MSISVDPKWADTHLPTEIADFCKNRSLKLKSANHRLIGKTRSILRFQRNGEFGIILSLELHDPARKVRKIIDLFQNGIWEGRGIFEGDVALCKMDGEVEFKNCLRAHKIEIKTPEAEKHFQFFQHLMNKWIIQVIQVHFLNEPLPLLSRCLNLLPFPCRYKLLYFLK